MALNNFDDENFNPDLEPGEEFTPEPPEPGQPSTSKSFWVAIGIISAILILALVLLVLIAPGIISKQRQNNIDQAAAINAANTATAMAATAMAIPAATNTPVIASNPTKTPVVSVGSTSTPVIGGGALSTSEIQTVQALQTQIAAQSSGTPAATSTQLPTTGIADEYGLPGLVGLAVILIAVVFLSRKLRTSAR